MLSKRDKGKNEKFIKSAHYYIKEAKYSQRATRDINIVKTLLIILLSSLLCYPVSHSLADKLTKSQLSAEVSKGIKSIDEVYDDLINIQKKQIRSQLIFDGLHYFLIETLYKEREYTILKTTKKITFLQTFRLPIDLTAKKAIDKVRNKGIENINSIYFSELDGIEDTIVNLKSKRQNPYHYFDIHENRFIDYVEKRENLYRDREKELNEIINKTQKSKMDIWK